MKKIENVIQENIRKPEKQKLIYYSIKFLFEFDYKFDFIEKLI